VIGMAMNFTVKAQAKIPEVRSLVPTGWFAGGVGTTTRRACARRIVTTAAFHRAGARISVSVVPF